MTSMTTMLQDVPPSTEHPIRLSSIRRPSRLAPTAADTLRMDSPDDGSAPPEPLAFNRRYEHRIPTGGWAGVHCTDPLKIFRGGTMELIDISPSGVSLLTDHEVEPGEVVEVQLAPFKVRGRLGVVRSCLPVELGLTPSLSSSSDSPDHMEKSLVRYRLGVHFPRAVRAA